MSWLFTRYGEIACRKLKYEKNKQIKDEEETTRELVRNIRSHRGLGTGVIKLITPPKLITPEQELFENLES